MEHNVITYVDIYLYLQKHVHKVVCFTIISKMSTMKRYETLKKAISKK